MSCRSRSGSWQHQPWFMPLARAAVLRHQLCHQLKHTLACLVLLHHKLSVRVVHSALTAADKDGGGVPHLNETHPASMVEYSSAT